MDISDAFPKFFTLVTVIRSKQIVSLIAHLNLFGALFEYAAGNFDETLKVHSPSSVHALAFECSLPFTGNLLRFFFRKLSFWDLCLWSLAMIMLMFSVIMIPNYAVTRTAIIINSFMNHATENICRLLLLRMRALSVFHLEVYVCASPVLRF